MKEIRNERTCKYCLNEGGAVVFLEVIITEDREFWACPLCHSQYEEYGSEETAGAGIRCCPMCGDGVFKIIKRRDVKWIMRCGGCDVLLEHINEKGEIRFYVENQQD